MRLFITIEAQTATESGLSTIMWNVTNKLDFVTNRFKDLENINNYGTEFKEIAIIPSCMDDTFWQTTGWKERKQIWRKKGEADIRLRMDYDKFIASTPENRYLMFVDIIIKSIQVVQERSKGDFDGKKLITDILSELDITKEQLNNI